MNKKLKEDVIPGLGIISVILVLFIYAYFDNKSKKENLMKNYEFTNALIIGYEGGGKGIGGFSYYFFIDSIRYEGQYAINSANTNHYTGKSFQVAYSPKDPNNSQLILTNKDYEKFGLSYPDTLPPLNWREMGRE
jgi:hypothetical protein